jgi:hypothetical protein
MAPPAAHALLVELAQLLGPDETIGTALDTPATIERLAQAWLDRPGEAHPRLVALIPLLDDELGAALDEMARLVDPGGPWLRPLRALRLALLLAEHAGALEIAADLAAWRVQIDEELNTPLGVSQIDMAALFGADRPAFVEGAQQAEE